MLLLMSAFGIARCFTVAGGLDLDYEHSCRFKSEWVDLANTKDLR